MSGLVFVELAARLSVLLTVMDGQSGIKRIKTAAEIAEVLARMEKAHSDYKDVKQTVLTRVSAEELTDAE